MNKQVWYKNVLNDMRIVVEVPVRIWTNYGTPEYWEKLEKELNWEIEEFENFIRDHRSRDSYSFYVERVHTLTCRHCGYDYGIIEEPVDLIPVCCEKAMEEAGWQGVRYEGQ